MESKKIINLELKKMQTEGASGEKMAQALKKFEMGINEGKGIDEIAKEYAAFDFYGGNGSETIQPMASDDNLGDSRG